MQAPLIDKRSYADLVGRPANWPGSSAAGGHAPTRSRTLARR